MALKTDTKSTISRINRNLKGSNNPVLLERDQEILRSNGDPAALARLAELMISIETEIIEEVIAAGVGDSTPKLPEIAVLKETAQRIKLAARRLQAIGGKTKENGQEILFRYLRDPAQSFKVEEQAVADDDGEYTPLKTVTGALIETGGGSYVATGRKLDSKKKGSDARKVDIFSKVCDVIETTQYSSNLNATSALQADNGVGQFDAIVRYEQGLPALGRRKRSQLRCNRRRWEKTVVFSNSTDLTLEGLVGITLQEERHDPSVASA